MPVISNRARTAAAVSLALWLALPATAEAVSLPASYQDTTARATAVRQVMPRGGDIPAQQNGDDGVWVPLLLLGGLLVASAGGYLVYALRRPAET
ncbi:hypothetical protein ACFWY9_38830 [Amycolatopsis sp. NPDC059027]|uniref:hypothetical protein n=1 Tax=unclassified Amycolatopsis TaxID=2618356 RepID=UPI00366A7D20